MAIINGGPNIALQMTLIRFTDMLSRAPTDQSSTEETLQNPGGLIGHIFGTNLTYDANGVVTSGTITGISEDYDSTSVRFSFSGLSLDGAQVHAWVTGNNESALSHAILAGNDTITGTPFDDLLQGLDGHDIMVGGPGGDFMLGGNGNDHLYGQSGTGGTDGPDIIYGEAGLDYLQGNAGNDYLNGGDGADRINGGADNDTIVGEFGNDAINGNLGNDSIDGGGNDDFLRGGQGDDSIDGGGGRDTIMGDLGNDTIIGGGGPSLMTGGDGADTFVLFGRDFAFPPSFTAQGGHVVITDFAPGVDRLELFNGPAHLHSVDPASDFTTAENEAQALFTSLPGKEGDVALAQVGSDTYLFWATGSGSFLDSTVQLQHVSASALQASDFATI